ncbi:MAG: GGDEF domain-containing protein [Nitrosomonadales bacterium]|nr:GGDEF domain-containing protein [Nitrosomonadales bacterium]
MRYGIGFKLGVLFAAFGILASGLTGYYSYSSSRAMLLAASERDLLTATQVLGRNMLVSLGAIGKDARLLAALPRAAKISQFSKSASIEEDTKVLATIFNAMLETHPEYFQIRLISADMNGLELVRVDRDGKSLTRVMAGDLQEKGHHPYVFETLRLKHGDIRLSKIEINHEEGAHSGLNKPTLRVATPVIADNGRVLGLIVINVDLNGLFGLLKADLPSAYNLYLSNEAGDFLIHPDATRTFGFEQGRRILVQDDFEPVAEVVQGKRESIVMNIEAARMQQDRLVAAFVRLPLGDTAEKRAVIIGLSQPLEHVVREATRLGWYTIQIVLVFSGLALILAALVSRVVTRPMNAMVQAIRSFSKERVISPMPTGRKDEIGVLARSFHDMQKEMVEYLTELKDSRNILEHIARHDPLTGLPNRTLFYDRMQQAIIQARRDKTRLALMFIDLDQFKQINDTLGHHTGDLLLKAVADRMQQCVRESDTVGRLGGDEFVVLLHFIEGQQDALLVAEKIRQAVNQPFDLDGHALVASVSIGVAIYPEHGRDEMQLSVNADRAMYLAKGNGRNRVHPYQN